MARNIADVRMMSDEELVALVLDRGSPDAGARLAAIQLLELAQGLAGLDRIDCRARQVLGRGWAKRLTVVQAALELGRRALTEPVAEGVLLTEPAQVYAHFRGRLPQLEREMFYVLLLDGRNRLQGEVRVSEGSLTSTLVHPREVFAPAIRNGAAAVLLVHNHPSGDPAPSAEDTVITRRLAQVGELVGIRVVDHVVVARNGFVSLAERGW